MTDKEKEELYLKTILLHRTIVADICNKMGIPEIGQQHDLSKFTNEEFSIYKWADGKMSPHDNARKELGYSPSWVYHKGRNPHHWEYWLIF